MRSLPCPTSGSALGSRAGMAHFSFRSFAAVAKTGSAWARTRANPESVPIRNRVQREHIFPDYRTEPRDRKLSRDVDGSRCCAEPTHGGCQHMLHISCDICYLLCVI